MKTPHKHAAVIKAWADGAGIQVCGELVGDDWVDIPDPSWNECCQYRIKPEPKPDVVRHYRIEVDSNNYAVGAVRVKLENLKLTFDGETGKLKSAEVV